MKEKEQTIEEVLDEIAELEANQHPSYYKNEALGRKRFAELLSKLNAQTKE